LIPNLGVVRLEDEISYTIADIPGLIEGAHLGKGLGIQFLRHIERTKMLLFILDATRPNPIEDYEKLCNELRLYNPELMDKHQIIALNKSEVADDIEQKVSEFAASTKYNVYSISAISRTNTTPILWEIWKTLQENSSIE
jgi:GTPase